MKAEKLIFLIPYSHLDTQWRWEYPTTINKYLRSTLAENLYLFEKFPRHRINFTGALRYAMMKEYYPEDFEKVRKLVAEGRWFPSGTCMDETDALVPSVESMVRNILYGHGWAMRELGKSSRDYMVPDCFGFPANMPTVLAHCGVSGFSSAKLAWGSAVGIPFDIGVWKGPDGSEIVSALNPCKYDSHLCLPIFFNPGRLNRLQRLGKNNGVWKSFQYYGVGDIGGAPTQGSVRRASASMDFYDRKGGGLSLRQGSPDQFFAGLTQEEKRLLGRYEGDFLLTKHSAGSISSAAIMKRWNRLNENLAFAAEAAALSATLLSGAPYPAVKVASAWKRILGSQMHDILPGTSTPTAYEYAHNDEAVALSTWKAILRDSAEEIAPFVPGDGNILLYNPCAEPRRDAVDIELPFAQGEEGLGLTIRDSSGNILPSQVRISAEGSFVATFICDLPPLGWSRVSIDRPSSRVGEPKQAIADPVKLERHDGAYTLENAAYRVKLSASGCLYSIYRKDIGKEFLKKPLAYELQKERPFEFPSWNMDWRDRKRKPRYRIEDGGMVRVLEEGPLRSTLELSTPFKSSLLIREISLCAGSDTVDFTERIEWRESGYSLKLALSADIAAPQVTGNWESSRIAREVNHRKTYEFPSRNWIDISGMDGGVSIIEDSKYGYDRPCPDTLRMTLLYTPAIWYINGFWDQKSQDWGSHTIRYALYAHSGTWENTDSLAKRFNQKVQAFSLAESSTARQKARSMDLVNKPDGFSLLSLSNPQFGVLAVKKPEEGDGVLIRVYERHGKPGECEIKFPFPIASATEVNGLEEIGSPVPSRGNSLSVRIDANAIRAFLVHPGNARAKLTLRQEALRLEFDTRLTGENGEAIAALFPAELRPDALSSGSVVYSLAPKGENDALCCKGQKTELPKGYDRLSILIGSLESCEAVFSLHSIENHVIDRQKRTVSAMTGFLAQWDRRIWRREPRHSMEERRDYAWINRCTGIKPGYVNRNRLEWFSTHTHSLGDDRAYRYGYLFTLELDLPKEAASLVLPDDPRIHIMAMTVSERPCKATPIRRLHDAYDF